MYIDGKMGLRTRSVALGSEPLEIVPKFRHGHRKAFHRERTKCDYYRVINFHDYSNHLLMRTAPKTLWSFR